MIIDMLVKQRNPYVDILKALGIISIVIGHASWELPVTGFMIGPFVYTYHIMIFFFVAGFCFKNEHALQPYLYIGNRIQRLVLPYMRYVFVFVILHNAFRYFHIISSEQSIYNLDTILKNILSSVILSNSETLLGAFWFIPILFFAEAIFLCYVLFCRKAKK